MSRAQEIEAFDLLTPAQLAVIAGSARTVEETHQVGRLATVLFGLPTGKPRSRRTPAEQELVDLHDTVHVVRRRLTTAALSDEDREALNRQRELETAEHQRIQAAHRRGAARDRAIDRRNTGQYLTPHERSLLNSA